MPEELPPAPPKRVRRLSTGQSGVVLETKDDQILVHWGTVAIPDPPRSTREQKFTDWVPKSDLELYPDPVFYGDPETNRKDKVYDPDRYYRL